MGVWDMHSCTSPFLTVNVGMTSRELLNVILLDELMFIGAERFWNIVGSVQVKLDHHFCHNGDFCLLFLKEKNNLDHIEGIEFCKCFKYPLFQ